jgi:hypothetical protein
MPARSVSWAMISAMPMAACPFGTGGTDSTSSPAKEEAKPARRVLILGKERACR